MSKNNDTDCLKRIDDIETSRIVFGIIFAVSAAISLTLLILVTITIRRIKHLKQLPVYTLIIFLNITQIIYQIPIITVLLPCTFTTCKFYSNVAMFTLAWPETFGFYSTAVINWFIAVERISVFHSEFVHKLLEKHTLLSCLISWLFGVLTTVFTTAIGCYKRFNQFSLRFSYECSHCEIFAAIDVRSVLATFAHITIFIMILGYIILTITVKIKMCQNPDNRTSFFSREVQLAMQGFFICFCQWLDSLAFFVIPLIGTTKIVALLSGMILILNGAIQPVVLLVFNKTIRNRFVAYFIPKETKIDQLRKCAMLDSTRTTVYGQPVAEQF